MEKAIEGSPDKVAVNLHVYNLNIPATSHTTGIQAQDEETKTHLSKLLQSNYA